MTIYVKNVTICKDFNGNLIDPVNCSVIASELKAIASSTQQYLLRRIENLYLCALQRGHNCIILKL
jgi:hypothetical protein